VSTKRAERKHKTSFDRFDGSWQLPPMHIGERISRARQAAGISQGRLAQIVGTAQTTISSWERGRTEPTRADVQRVASAIGVPPSQLEFDEGSRTPGARMVPLVGYVGAGAVAHYYASSDGQLDMVEAPPGSSERTVASEIRGDSLGPLFENWLIFYDDVRTPVTADLYGRLCIVGLPDDRILVKKIKPAGLQNHFHLLSNNEEPLLDQEVLWAARVRSMTPKDAA
jgi:transcriptional regulator with XRE-family HTH domain